jgi:alkaline phosphatase D
MDKWDGYVPARNRLYSRLLETKAPNPIVLSGDVHQHLGADLKRDFTDPRSAIRYHSARRGYIACTAMPDAMRADFKILDKVSEPNRPARTGGSLVVEAGRPGSSTA